MAGTCGNAPCAGGNAGGALPLPWLHAAAAKAAIMLARLAHRRAAAKPVRPGWAVLGILALRSFSFRVIAIILPIVGVSSAHVPLHMIQDQTQHGRAYRTQLPQRSRNQS